MAESANILDRTELFIKAYRRLEADSKLPENKHIAKMIGYNSASSISNILARRQNITAQAWKTFKDLFGIKEGKNNSEDLEIEINPREQNDPSPLQIMMTLTEAFRALSESSRSQTEILKIIENKMAREDTQAAMETNLNEVRSIVDKLSKGQNKGLEILRQEFAKIHAEIVHPTAKDKRKIGGGEGG